MIDTEKRSPDSAKLTRMAPTENGRERGSGDGIAALRCT